MLRRGKKKFAGVEVGWPGDEPEAAGWPGWSAPRLAACPGFEYVRAGRARRASPRPRPPPPGARRASARGCCATSARSTPPPRPRAAVTAAGGHRADHPAARGPSRRRARDGPGRRASAGPAGGLQQRRHPFAEIDAHRGRGGGCRPTSPRAAPWSEPMLRRAVEAGAAPSC